MRNAIAILAAVCAGSALMGCNSHHSAPASVAPIAPPPAVPRAEPNWTLTLRSQCSETEPESCLAGWGFSVLSDGTYRLGPGPNKEIRTGNLTSEEMASIKGVMGSTLAGAHAQAEGHDTIEEGSESDDTVTFSLGGSDSDTQSLVKTQGQEMSYQTESLAEAKSLLAAVRELARKYYSVPFPDACKDSAAELAKYEETLQTCTIDSDCTYLSSTLEAITPQSNEYITTDDCSVIMPLTVANASLLKANKDKLIAQISQVQNACGFNLSRNDCASTTGFQLPGTAPVCTQGVCKASVTSLF